VGTIAQPDATYMHGVGLSFFSNFLKLSFFRRL